jgi:hypothetical protein
VLVTRARWLVFVSAPLLTLVVACADGVSRQDCIDDRVCEDGFVCAFGTCLNPADQRLSTVSVEVDPSAAGLPIQSVEDIDLRSTPRVEVTLAGGVLVTGVVALEGGEPRPTGIEAVVLARPRRSIPGRVLAPLTSSVADGSWELLVVDGVEYVVAAVPADRSLPPLYDAASFRARAGADGGQTLEPLLVPADLVVLTGRVRAGEGVSAQGVPDVDVRLVDDGGRVWSSVSRTGADGSFAVALARGLGDLTLEVLPTTANDKYPTVRVAGVDATESLDMGIISLGVVFTPVSFQARVVAAGGAPGRGARATFTAAVGAGTFTRTAVADDGGMLFVELPPGSYEAVVLGPAEQPAAGLLIAPEVDVPAANTEVAFQLPGRVPFSGRVLDHEEAPIAEATLDVVRIGDVDGDLEPALADKVVAFRTSSLADGSFSVLVDPGRYRVSTRPAPGGRVPAFSQLVTVSAEGLERDVTLPPRAIVAGSVAFQGAAVRGAWLRVFSALLDEQGAAILLGEGPVGPDGSFEIAVPDLVPEGPEPDRPEAP